MASLNHVRGYFRKFDEGGKQYIREILGGGGNVKTCVAVYEEGLFDLGEGGKTF